MWCPDDTQHTLTQAQTKIYVLIYGKEMFIKATELLEKGLPHHHARSCHPRDFPGAGKIAQVTIGFCGKSAHCMISSSVHPENDPRMLHCAIVVKKKRACGSHVR